MAKRTVIVTADDFGRWPEVNDAVLAGYDDGMLSTAALRVTATASSSAMVSASMRPGLCVGLYLVLCDGQATLPHRHVPDLVDTTGRFVKRPLEAAWLYRRGGGLRDELRAEIRAQLEKFLASGLDLAFVAGHWNLHLLPSVFGILQELAGEYPIAALRKPCGQLVKHDRRRGISAFQRAVEAASLRSATAWGSIRARGFAGPDRVAPLCTERPATESAVIERLRSVGRGITELVAHPGSFLPRYDGDGEAAIVTSPTVRKAVNELDIDIVSYREIVQGGI